MIALALLSALALAASDAPRSEAAGASVILDGQTVFPVQAPLGAFTPEDRARASSERLHALARHLYSDPDVRVVDVEGVFEVVSGDAALFSVTPSDAKLAGRPLAELANDEARRTREALRRYYAVRSKRSLLISSIEALGWTVALALLLMGVVRGCAWLRRKVHAWEQAAQGLKLQGLVLLTPARIAEILDFAIRTLRWVLTALLLYLYLPLILELFPWTRGIAQTLVGYVTDPLMRVGLALAGYLPKLVFVAIAIVLARLAIRFVDFLFQEIGRGTVTIAGFYTEWARPTFQIARILIMVFTAVVVFPYLPGAQSSAFQNISLFVGLLLSLGSSSAVANGVAGVILTYTRAFRVGDRVRIGDAEGDVVEKTLLVTRLKTIKNVHVAIPNAVVLSAHVSNFSLASADEPLVLHTEVTIGYDTPWRQVHALLCAAALRTDHILPQPAPFVLQPHLDDFYVTYQLNAFTDAPKRMAQTYSELHQNIQDAFAQAQVEIMSPHYTSLRDGSSPALPSTAK